MSAIAEITKLHQVAPRRTPCRQAGSCALEWIQRWLWSPLSLPLLSIQLFLFSNSYKEDEQGVAERCSAM